MATMLEKRGSDSQRMVSRLCRARTEAIRCRQPGKGMPGRQLFSVTIPTAAGLVEALEAFALGGLAALGLRASLFDFF